MLFIPEALYTITYVTLYSRIISFYATELSFIYRRCQQFKLDYRRMVNVELSGMLQGNGRSLFKILSRHFEKNHENCVCVCVCIRCPCRGLNGELPEYEQEMLAAELLCCGLRLCMGQNCVGLSCGGDVVGSIVKRKDVGKPVTQMSLRGQKVKEIRCLSFGMP